jgi:hypothetical protein
MNFQAEFIRYFSFYCLVLAIRRGIMKIAFAGGQKANRRQEMRKQGKIFKGTNMKQLVFVFCLIVLIFSTGCREARQRRINRYYDTQQAQKLSQRQATVERFMEKYPDNWKEKLKEYDDEVAKGQLK